MKAFQKVVDGELEVVEDSDVEENLEELVKQQQITLQAEKELVDQEHDLEFVFKKTELDDSSDAEDEDDQQDYSQDEDDEEGLGKRPPPAVEDKTTKKLKKGKKIEIEFEEPDISQELMETLQMPTDF